MKIKINAAGFLHIRRPDEWQEQTCPVCETPCGDWCPLFGEPEVSEMDYVVLEICQGRQLWCSAKDFVDERVKK
jgi:hypothetical protein